MILNAKQSTQKCLVLQLMWHAFFNQESEHVSIKNSKDKHIYNGYSQLHVQRILSASREAI